MDRRNFITVTFFAMAAWLLEACTAVKSAGSESGVTFNLTDFPSLQDVGGTAQITLQNKKFTAVRESQKTLHVVSQKCTHRGCTLFIQADGRGFECPCHGSSFDLEGNVTRGPAARSLETRTVVFNEAAGTFSVI